MASRLKLHSELETILGSKNVYYQPPASMHLKYPCIVYKKRAMDSQYADNIAYIHKQSYTITVIDTNPDSELDDRMAEFPLTRSESSFCSGNLYHDVFVTYY